MNITVARPGDLDQYGATRGNPVTFDVAGVSIAPGDSADTTGRGRSGAVDHLTLYVPFGTDIRTADQVTIHAGPYAGTWQVDGNPGHWESPFNGRRSGATINLKLAAG